MNILRLNNINGELDARLNILHFEIGIIIPNNGFKWNRLPDQFENCLHRNARPGNARFPKMNFGADLNSIHVANVHYSGHKPQAGPWPDKTAGMRPNQCPILTEVSLTRTGTLPSFDPCPESRPVLHSASRRRTANRHLSNRSRSGGRGIGGHETRGTATASSTVQSGVRHREKIR
jgi:hypothetical protein